MPGNNVVNLDADVIIFGGGIAGLWSLVRLQQAGYNTLLLESEALGAGQTLYAQGIIHGGTKYALTGKLTASSEAVADMPSRWRSCYNGDGDVDLTSATLNSDAHYLWSTNTLTSKISGFFASKVMRNRTAGLEQESLPSLFQHNAFKGQVYQLDEPVFDTLSVIHAIAGNLAGSILHYSPDSLDVTDRQCLSLVSQQGHSYQIKADKIILMAGEGNEELISRFGIKQPEMQKRPLKMVAMRGNLHDRVYAHCMGGSVNPRITITSHQNAAGNIVWYMGGQLAEDGVGKTDTQLLADTKKELDELIPWLDTSNNEFAVLKVDRAEIKKPGTTRPDTFTFETHDGVTVAWPTKMALSPALADAIVELLSNENVKQSPQSHLPENEQPVYADFPWNTANWIKV